MGVESAQERWWGGEGGARVRGWLEPSPHSGDDCPPRGSLQARRPARWLILGSYPPSGPDFNTAADTMALLLTAVGKSQAEWRGGCRASSVALHPKTRHLTPCHLPPSEKKTQANTHCSRLCPPSPGITLLSSSHRHHLIVIIPLSLSHCHHPIVIIPSSPSPHPLSPARPLSARSAPRLSSPWPP